MNASENSAALILSGNRLAASDRAYRLTSAAIVRELTDLIGSAAVAGVGGVKNSRSVYQWLSGERQPGRLDALRFALQLADILRFGGETDATIRAWFTGANIRLEGVTPIALLASKPVATVGPPLMSALLAFIESSK